MKTNLITFLCTLIAGVLFIVFRTDNQIIDVLTIIIAFIFIIPGIGNFIGGLRALKRNQQKAIANVGLMLISIGAIVLGVLMIAIPDIFANYVALTLGALLALSGIFQLMWLLRSYAVAKSRWFLIGPVLVLIAGVVVMILQADRLTPDLWLTTGIVLIAYSLNGLIAMKLLPTVVSKGNGKEPVIIK